MHAVCVKIFIGLNSQITSGENKICDGQSSERRCAMDVEAIKKVLAMLGLILQIVATLL
jgi:hypothetical protein